jgi:hypothetical protein
MQQITRVSVKNLAQPGRTCGRSRGYGGQRQFRGPCGTDRNRWKRSAHRRVVERFWQPAGCDLSKVAATGRIVVMFEFPSFPHWTAYGQIQRRPAAGYGVWLIPMRYFIDVIGGANAIQTACSFPVRVPIRWRRLWHRPLSSVLRPPAAIRVTALPARH